MEGNQVLYDVLGVGLTKHHVNLRRIKNLSFATICMSFKVTRKATILKSCIRLWLACILCSLTTCVLNERFDHDVPKNTKELRAEKEFQITELSDVNCGESPTNSCSLTGVCKPCEYHLQSL